MSRNFHVSGIPFHKGCFCGLGRYQAVPLISWMVRNISVKLVCVLGIPVNLLGD